MLTSLSILLTHLSILVAQVRPGGPPPSSSDPSPLVVILLSCCCPLLVTLVFLVPMFWGMAKAFGKAGEPGIAAFIPIWQTIVLCKIAGKDSTRWILWLIPFAGIYFAIVDTIDFAKAYGKEAGFGIGLVFLPYIFYPMLGFGSARYVGAPSSGLARRRRYEDEEEEEEPRPRPRPRPRRRDEDEQ